jgi:hypothetical protein
MRRRLFGVRRAGAVLAVLTGLAMTSPASASPAGASGSFQVLGVQNGVMQLSVTVNPGPGACESIGSTLACDWYALVDVESAPGSSCTLYATSDPSGTLGSQANGAPQTAQVPLVTQVASGNCLLTLRYNDLAGTQVLAQQPYSFPGPAATFSGVTGTTPLAGDLVASASVTLSEPICPSDGACAWFGFVIAEPASVGCPAAITPGSGPAPIWVGDVLDSPGTESATLSQGWNLSSGPLLWCGYIDGPGAPGAGAGLFGQATYTRPPRNRRAQPRRLRPLRRRHPRHSSRSTR